LYQYICVHLRLSAAKNYLVFLGGLGVSAVQMTVTSDL
jgi:hypothetical protein